MVNTPKTALIIIDIQQDYFEGGKMPLHNMTGATQNAQALATACREKGYPVFFIQHITPNENAPLFAKNSDGINFHESLIPQSGDIVIQKEKPNAFVGTGLNEILQENSIANLIICGAMSHMCISSTTRHAAEYLGYPVRLAHDACATLDLEFQGHTVPAPHVHHAAMAAMAFAFADVQSTADILAAL
jgi:nicotinamidase-related amidase